MALKPLDADEGYTKPKKGKKAKAAREASDEESEMDLDPVSDWMPQHFLLSFRHKLGEPPRKSLLLGGWAQRVPKMSMVQTCSDHHFSGYLQLPQVL